MRKQRGASFVEVLVCASIFVFASMTLIAHLIHTERYTQALQAQRTFMQTALNTYAEIISADVFIAQGNSEVTVNNHSVAVKWDSVQSAYEQPTDTHHSLTITVEFNHSDSEIGDDATNMTTQNPSVSPIFITASVANQQPAPLSGRWQDLGILTN